MVKIAKIANITLFIITILLFIVTFGANLSECLSPEEFSLSPVLALLLPMLLVANVCFLIYWLVRCYYWSIFPIAALVMSISYISRVYQVKWNDVKVSDSSVSVKLATYNVHSFGKETDGYSCKKIAQYMDENSVDIICFQEFVDNDQFTVDSIKHVFTTWRYKTIVPHTEKVLPLAVFSKYPIISSQLVMYPDSRNCTLICDVLIGKKQVRLFNNHLQTTNMSSRNSMDDTDYTMQTLIANATKRGRQAEALQHMVMNSPHQVLVCGDFNDVPSSYTYRMARGKLKDGFQTAGQGYAYTYRYYKRMLRIDYIFHSESLQGIDYYSPNQELCSDHNPVIMQLGVPQQ
ncbi:endonuclease/exonuclease/phosphatase family protein [Bacteroides graminisolvens]|uniref:endonuclease/exonuclease/phosphatase family protein n=1 Tax=Bacteroides graminisolvens TaxID=477666 RepID=UPI0029C6A880|nr:endonuclease/exonuclease/phosphatase family protein [Bacteroides graminisolvens]